MKKILFVIGVFDIAFFSGNKNEDFVKTQHFTVSYNLVLPVCSEEITHPNS